MLTKAKAEAEAAANETMDITEGGGQARNPVNDTEDRCTKVAHGMRVLCDALGETSEECAQVTKRFQVECGE